MRAKAKAAIEQLKREPTVANTAILILLIKKRSNGSTSKSLG